MGSTKSKKRDQNRYRKVYPYLRRRPRNHLCTDEPITIEAGEITFSNSSAETYAFREVYVSAPTVTAISVDSEGNNSANVNVFISTITTTEVTIETSQAFTGKVYFHVIRIG